MGHKRTIATLAAAAALLLGVLGAAPVHAKGLDGSSIWIYEGRGTLGKGDYWRLWKSDSPRSIPNLANYDQNLFLGCDDTHLNWNNCISTLYIDLYPGTCIKFYDGANYTTQLLFYYNTNSSLHGFYVDLYTQTNADNKITSFRWGDWVATGPTDHICQMGAYD